MAKRLVHVLLNVGWSTCCGFIITLHFPQCPLTSRYYPQKWPLLPCIFFDSIRKDFQCDVGYVLGDATAPGVSKKDSHL